MTHNKANALKKISLLFMALSMVSIIYFFIKEQFNGVVLSSQENTIIYITYFVMGISFFILKRIQFLEKKNEGKRK